MTRRVANRCEYCRLSRDGQEASFPIDHITPSARGNATKPAHLTLACVSLPPAGNWVRSACPIPPWFVVSFALSTTSTRANWLRSGAFLSPRAPPLRIHWPLFFCSTPHSGTSGVRSCADHPPPGYCLTPTSELTKTERDPILTSGPSIFSMSPNQAIAADKINLFLPTRRRQPLTTPSWPEALKASGSKRACRIARSRNARASSLSAARPAPSLRLFGPRDSRLCRQGPRLTTPATPRTGRRSVPD